MLLLLLTKSTTTTTTMKTSLSSSAIKAITIILLALFSLIKHTNAGAYDLPAGTLKQTGLLGNLKRTFKCEAEGYFADVDNDCKIYHQCNSFNSKKGSPNTKYAQTTMACGKDQIFDQSKFACKDESDAIPCEASSDFFYLNERIGDKTADFLTDADIEKAQAARPEYRAAAAAKRRRSPLMMMNKSKKRRRHPRSHHHPQQQQQQQQQPQQFYPVINVDNDLDFAASNVHPNTNNNYLIDDKVVITSPKLLKITKSKSKSKSKTKSKSTKSSKSKQNRLLLSKKKKGKKSQMKKRNIVDSLQQQQQQQPPKQQQQQQQKPEVSKIFIYKMNR